MCSNKQKSMKHRNILEFYSLYFELEIYLIHLQFIKLSEKNIQILEVISS